MAKKFSELKDKMPAHARELVHQVEWLQAQNADTKHYVNEMVRNVMKLQTTALRASI